MLNVEHETIPTRQSLLSRLKDWEDQESWKTFFDTYWKLIYNAGIKAGLTDAEAQDAVQETIVCVLKSMPTFKYNEESSFKGWLLRLTSWRIVDQVRKRQRGVQLIDDRGGFDMTEMMERIADPISDQLEANWDQEWEDNLMDAAIERVKKKVDYKHYQVFDLHVFKKWPVTKVARTLNISSGKVYLLKHRINRLIKKEVESLRIKPI